MNKDILICGVGGQGTVLASKILAAAAMEEGNSVHSAETIGMAQRGGSVTSHVRIGENVFSPLIPLGCADMILAFEPAEADPVSAAPAERGKAVKTLAAKRTDSSRLMIFFIELLFLYVLIVIIKCHYNRIIAYHTEHFNQFSALIMIFYSNISL